MDMQTFFNSRWGVGLGLFLGRIFPPSVSYRLGEWLATKVANQHQSPLVRAVRLNQWVVRGKRSTPEELDQAVLSVLKHAARSLLDLYQYLLKPRKMETLVDVSPKFEELIHRSQDWTAGEVIVAPHLSNFDLALQVLGRRELLAQILSHPNPTSGYLRQNKLRAQAGFEITPSSTESFHQATHRLQRGGLVATGVDLPIARKSQRLMFFGHPAPLPVGHIRLALRAGVPVRVAAIQQRPDQTYLVDISDPIPMQPHPDQSTEIQQNAEAVLKVLASYIQKTPDQWLMFFPVWEELLPEVP